MSENNSIHGELSRAIKSLERRKLDEIKETSNEIYFDTLIKSRISSAKIHEEFNRIEHAIAEYEFLKIFDSGNESHEKELQRLKRQLAVQTARIEEAINNEQSATTNAVVEAIETEQKPPVVPKEKVDDGDVEASSQNGENEPKADQEPLMGEDQETESSLEDPSDNGEEDQAENVQNETPPAPKRRSLEEHLNDQGNPDTDSEKLLEE